VNGPLSHNALLLLGPLDTTSHIIIQSNDVLRKLKNATVQVADYQLLRVHLILEDDFRAFLDSSCHKSTNAFTLLFGSSRHHVVRQIVEISRDGMWKALSGPTTFATVALFRHTRILLVAKLMLR